MNDKEKAIVKEFVTVVRYYLDPDEPKEEWEDGVWATLNKVEELLGETK